MSAASVDVNDIQGIVRFGYASLTEAFFLLLTIHLRWRSIRASVAQFSSGDHRREVKQGTQYSVAGGFYARGTGGNRCSSGRARGILCGVFVRDGGGGKPLQKAWRYRGQLSRIVAVGWAGGGSPRGGDGLCAARQDRCMDAKHSECDLARSLHRALPPVDIEPTGRGAIRIQGWH